MPSCSVMIECDLCLRVVMLGPCSRDAEGDEEGDAVPCKMQLSIRR